MLPGLVLVLALLVLLVDMLAETVKGSLKKLGAFPVVIPAIPFVSPNEKILSFSADDIDNLVAYIKGAK